MLSRLGGAVRDRERQRQRATRERAVDETLLSSIHDVQTAISANDSKASAALIVHGLLVTGVLTLLVHLGSIYSHASHSERVLALFFLFASLAAFLGSIGFLLAALLPYRPKRIDRQLREHHANQYREVFFPVRLLGEADPYAELLRRTRQLQDNGVTTELAAERIKLADVLRYESSQTKWGYRLLLLEVVCVTGFLIVVGLAAL